MNREEACRILNLTLGASKKDIRTSFLELSKKYHPDHNQDHVAHDMFIMIDKAYRFLMGEETPQPQPQQTPQPQPQQTSQPQPQQTQNSQGIDMSKMKDILDQIQSTFHNFDLDCVGLQDLQNIANRNNIVLTHLSTRTHRPIKKTKNELFYEIKKLAEFQRLYRLSYDQLVSLCESNHMPIVNKRKQHKSVIELVIDLL